MAEIANYPYDRKLLLMFLALKHSEPIDPELLNLIMGKDVSEDLILLLNEQLIKRHAKTGHYYMSGRQRNYIHSYFIHPSLWESLLNKEWEIISPVQEINYRHLYRFLMKRLNALFDSFGVNRPNFVWKHAPVTAVEKHLVNSIWQAIKQIYFEHKPDIGLLLFYNSKKEFDLHFDLSFLFDGFPVADDIFTLQHLGDFYRHCLHDPETALQIRDYINKITRPRHVISRKKHTRPLVENLRRKAEDYYIRGLMDLERSRKILSIWEFHIEKPDPYLPLRKSFHSYLMYLFLYALHFEENALDTVYERLWDIMHRISGSAFKSGYVATGILKRLMAFDTLLYKWTRYLPDEMKSTPEFYSKLLYHNMMHTYSLSVLADEYESPVRAIWWIKVALHQAYKLRQRGGHTELPAYLAGIHARAAEYYFHDFVEPTAQSKLYEPQSLDIEKKFRSAVRHQSLAAAYSRQVAEQYPQKDYLNLQTALNLFRLGEMYFRHRTPHALKRAARYFRKSIPWFLHTYDIKPSYPEAMGNIFQAYLLCGQTELLLNNRDQARQCLQNALIFRKEHISYTTDEMSVRAHTLLGEIAENQNRPSDAYDHYHKALVILKEMYRQHLHSSSHKNNIKPEWDDQLRDLEARLRKWS